MSHPVVVVHPDAASLAAAVAARLLTAAVDAQVERGEAHLVLTGGGIGTEVLKAVATSPAAAAVDWQAVHIWWGDERFLPEGDAERNETSARADFLEPLGVPDGRVHPMAASDGPDPDPEDAAAGYARELAAQAGSGAAVPEFDVLLLGVGPEGHVASLFPEAPGLTDERPVVAVLNSPKPPPTRISLTYPAINAARQVWLVASGTGKSEALALAAAGSGPQQLPAAGVAGTERTLWLVDRDAAGQVPAGPLTRLG